MIFLRISTARLYTWNAVSPFLSRMNLEVSVEDKALIVAGDEEVRMVYDLAAFESLVVTKVCLTGSDEDS